MIGLAGTFAGARLGLLTPAVLQLDLFALAMCAAAWRMLKPTKLVAAASGGFVNTGGGTAYHGAHWHTASEVLEFFSGLPVRNLRLRPAIFQPSGTPLATLLERDMPERLPWGGLLLMSGEKALGQQARPVT